MSLKQWTAVDRACHPKSSPHSPTPLITSDPTLLAIPCEAPPPASSQPETLLVDADNFPGGIALVLQEFRLSRPD